jgi:archaemetzincin
VSKAIHIYNSSEVHHRSLEPIEKTVRKVFNVPVTVSDVSLNLSEIYDSGREQYNSTALLAKILNTFEIKERKVIVIVDEDLFIPVLTFVFGEAQLDGSAAVVSTHRLKSQYYGLPKNEKVMLDRLEKEIIHELGHTFGMYHCQDYECVMKASTYVEEIDLKNAVPCSTCQTFISSGQASKK